MVLFYCRNPYCASTNFKIGSAKISLISKIDFVAVHSFNLIFALSTQKLGSQQVDKLDPVFYTETKLHKILKAYIKATKLSNNDFLSFVNTCFPNLYYKNLNLDYYQFY